MTFRKVKTCASSKTLRRIRKPSCSKLRRAMNICSVGGGTLVTAEWFKLWSTLKRSSLRDVTAQASLTAQAYCVVFPL